MLRKGKKFKGEKSGLLIGQNFLLGKLKQKKKAYVYYFDRKRYLILFSLAFFIKLT